MKKNNVNNSNTEFNKAEDMKMMKKELTQAKKQARTSIAMTVQVMKRTESGYTIHEEQRKFGLVKENRPIKTNVVNGFLQIIQGGKYDDTQSIVTIEATELLGKYNITDLEGNILPQEEAKDYLIVLDGQHRISAFSKLNSIREEEKQIIIPNVHIKTGLENIREYLADINMIGKSWNHADKVCVAAIGTKNKVLVKINDLIKEGYSVSTATLIYLGKKLSTKELNQIMKEENINDFPDEEKVIARAERFLTTAMSIEGMTVTILRKRFYINGFNSLATITEDEIAFKVLERLTIDDFIGVREDIEFLQRLKNILEEYKIAG